MLKAVCSRRYFVLLLNSQLILYHCSREPFREFWIIVMMWFSLRVTPKHKGFFVLPGYQSGVRENLLLVVFWTVYHVSSMTQKRRILSKVRNLEVESAWYPPHTLCTCLWTGHHQYRLRFSAAGVLFPGPATCSVRGFLISRFANEEPGFVRCIDGFIMA